MALDESLSYTKALAAWLASNCQDESQLLQGKALEDAKALVGCRSFSEQDYQFLIASQELEKRELLKQLEIARQETQSLATNRQIVQKFLINLAHELRTPLSGVISSLRLVIDGLVDDDEEEREFIDHAHHSAFHLLDLINELIDMAKIEADKLSVELAPIRLYELITKVENSVQTQAQARKKQLNLQVIRSATQDEITTYGDYYLLLQVILTLVGEAIKYTNDKCEITINTEIIDQKVMLQNQEYPGLVKIHITDAWNIYSQESLLRFLQQMNDSSIYQWYRTPTLKLAISKKLVEAMGGELHLDVKGEGGGATVTISLPLYQEPAIKSKPTQIHR